MPISSGGGNSGPSWSDPLGIEWSNQQQQNIDNAKLVKDSQSEEMEKLAKELGIKLSPETLDYLYSYMINEKSAENAYKRSLEASSTQYQRAVADLQKAGLNPFLALQSLSGSAPSSPSASVSGGYITQRYSSDKQSQTSYGTKYAQVIGILAAAFIGLLHFI